jgi:hypothetical protein
LCSFWFSCSDQNCVEPKWNKAFCLTIRAIRNKVFWIRHSRALYKYKIIITPAGKELTDASKKKAKAAESDEVLDIHAEKLDLQPIRPDETAAAEVEK